MKAVVVKPGQPPYVTDMLAKLSAMQDVVEGQIECLMLEEGVDLICNEEGKLDGLPLNRRMGDDIIAGTFFVVGYNDEGEHISLTDEQAEKYMVAFAEPEQFPKGYYPEPVMEFTSWGDEDEQEIE